MEKIQIAGESLKIVAVSERQKTKLMQLVGLSIDGKPVQVSPPLAVTRWQDWKTGPTPAAKPSAKFGPRGVVYGLKESGDKFNEIAITHGLNSLKGIGNPATSNTTLITFEHGAQLPTHIYIEGWRFKVWPYIPRPRRCNNCQAFDHATQACTKNTICSKCSGPHPFLECPNKESPKCVNCQQAHSAAYKKCSEYLARQQNIKTKIELYSDKARKGVIHTHTQTVKHISRP